MARNGIGERLVAWNRIDKRSLMFDNWPFLR
jgi:hypothetical protein